jgi:hypothetical protein
MGAEELHFKGQGSTPAERTAHMQRQLASLCTDGPFLAPLSWPACSCLTALATTRPHHLAAAMQTTSLVDLEAIMTDAAILSPLTAISRLNRNLAHFTIIGIDDTVLEDTPPAAVLHSMAALTNLRTLTINSRLEEHSWADFPPSFSRLSSLTRVYLDVGGLHLHHLAPLRAAQCVQLWRASILSGSLSDLFALSRLTSLHGHWAGSPLALDFTEAQQGGGAGGVAPPPAWRVGLQELSWSCRDPCCTLPLLAQLSSLVVLRLNSVRVTQEACR